MPSKKAPATAERVVAMAPLANGRLASVRDRALLLVGFAGAFRRSELVALNVEDIEETAEGLRITIRRSKTDQEGHGHVIAIPHGQITCPVHAPHHVPKEWADSRRLECTIRDGCSCRPCL
jgi:integrase